MDLSLDFVKDIQQKGQHKRVMVIGDAILDRYNYGEYVACEDEGMPMFKVKSTELCLGGALNVASNIRAVGLDTACVSIVGTDGGTMINMLQDRGIDTTGVIHRPGIQTKTITRYSSRSATLFRIDKVSDCVIDDVIITQLLENVKEMCGAAKYDLFVLCDYRNGMMTSDLCRGVISLARKRGIPVIVDPKRGDYDKYEGATIIKPNIDDAKILCGNDISIPRDAELVCKAFVHKFDIDICILTMSNNGIAYYFNDNIRGEKFDLISSKNRVHVIDPNGAGDAVTTAIAFGIVHGITLDQSCRFAIACAENVIKRYGTVALSLNDIIEESL